MSPGGPAGWLARWAGEQPDLPALTMAGETLTYGELDRRVGAAVAGLANAGIAAGTRVAALAPPQTLPMLAHALPRLGCPLLPLNPALPPGIVAGLADLCGIGAVVGGPGAAPRRILAPAVLSGQVGPIRERPLAADDVHLMIATSGSSGAPKAVMLTGANLAASVAASADRLPLAPGDVWLACLPLFHIGGMAILWRCAAAGASVVLHERFDTARLLDDMARHRVSHLSLVPTMLARLLDAGGGPPRWLRAVLVGGAALPAPLAGRALAAGWPIQPTYGMSETASQLATLAAKPGWRGGHVGAPLAGFRLRLDAAEGEAGRILVAGPAVMAGYANPALRRGDGLAGEWLATGDVGRLEPDGGLVVLGRIDDVLVTGGEKVHPAAVEEALAACPGISDVAVSGRPDPLWGEALVAIFAGTAEEHALLSFARERLPGHMRPRRAIRVAALPLGQTGKPDRAALRRLAAQDG